MLVRFRSPRGLVVAAYVAFVLIGLVGGAGGVLLVSQIDDYEITRTVFGITFFGGAAGYALAGLSAGVLDHKLGRRASLAVGGGAILLAGLVTASRPPFWVFAALTLLAGYGTGVSESVLNTCLAELPGAATLLNRLHAFFGVGAFIGPVFAERLLTGVEWPMVVLIVTLLQIPVTLALLLVHPDETQAREERTLAHEEAGTGSRPAKAAWSSPAVRWGALLLAVYVGVEMSAGNWGFSYLVDHHEQSAVFASRVMSAFWLGLTVGRFVLSPLTARFGMDTRGLMTLCVAGTGVICVLLSLAPWAWLVAVGMALLGFMLGPVFPTAIATAPTIVAAPLVPAAIGLMNAGSTVGGSILPWGAGVAGQHSGMRLVMPYLLLLAVLQGLAWWRMVSAGHGGAAQDAEPRPEEPGPAHS